MNGKTVLILTEQLSLESVEDKIVALGYQFQKKPLHSKYLLNVVNDLKQLNSSGELLAALLFLSKETLFNCCSEEDLVAWQQVLIELKLATSLIFIQNDNFQREFYDSKYELNLSEVDILIRNLYATYTEFLNQSTINGKISKFQNFNIELTKLGYLLYDFFKTAQDHFIEIDSLFLNEFIKITETKNTKIQALSGGGKVKQIIYMYNDKPFVGTTLLKTIMQEVKESRNLVSRLQNEFLEKLPEQKQRAQQLVTLIQKSGVEIVPYDVSKEISLRMHHFLDEVDKGIILHLYVPYGRYQEEQLASFLRLFESYLQRVEKLQFSIDTRKTFHGQVYEFKSKNTMMNVTDMEVAFARFEDFMDLCQYDQKKAEALLMKTGISPSEATRLLTKYAKEYRRIVLDYEHERERKLLDLRQRLESDALELAQGMSLTLTTSIQPSALLSLSPHADPISSITISNSSVIINPGIQSYVEQAIYGDIYYTTEDKELLELFIKYAQGLEAVGLKSDLEQLKDTSLPEVERKTAKQKIGGFLAKVAPAIGNAALTVLTAYVEKLLTGS